jgi:hypothetical protein
MLYNAYSYAVEKTHDNSEVQAYLKEIRKDDPSFYNGFEELAKAMVSAKR